MKLMPLHSLLMKNNTYEYIMKTNLVRNPTTINWLTCYPSEVSYSKIEAYTGEFRKKLSTKIVMTTYKC